MFAKIITWFLLLLHANNQSIQKPTITVEPPLQQQVFVQNTDKTEQATAAVTEQLSVPALVYHNIDQVIKAKRLSDLPYFVTPETLDQQLKYLSEQGYTGLVYEDIYNIQQGKMALPKKPIIISFDDGHESQYLNALPILKKYNFKAVFYVFTNALDRQGYMTWQQLKELQDAGMEIGDHTRFHWRLDKQPEDILIKEIKDTKALLESKLNKPIISLAYPFGTYNDQVIKEAQDAGFIYARGLKHSPSINKDNHFILGGYITQNSLLALQNILNGKP